MKKIGGVEMGTLITGVILLIIVGFIIRSMVKSKKSGKSIQCGCDCKHCSGHCHWLLKMIILGAKLFGKH